MLRAAMSVLALAGVVCAEGTPFVQIDQEVASFSVSDLQGKAVELDDLYGEGDKALVVVFWSITCPICTAQLGRLKATAGAYAKEGVRFVLVNPNPHEDEDAMAAYLEEKGLDLGFYRDKKKQVMKQFLASVTPAYYVLDGKRVLRYMGMLEQGKPGTKNYVAYLADALDAVLDGREVEVKTTRSSG